MSRRRYVVRGYQLCPDELLEELNGAANYAKITNLLRRFRAQKR